MSLEPLLLRHRVVACVGSGGVGKTTTAAALALHAALSGREVLCLTIDPARRLAQSLGIDGRAGVEHRVPDEAFARHGLRPRGVLWAMMLDPKRAFDELVTRRASSPQARERILGNRIYRHLSESLAGVQEYMAMEKLHEVRERGRWDLVVLDTPPTSNAIDFLEAPDKLIGLIDSPATRWLVQAFESERRRFSLDLLGRGAAYLLRGLSRFTGLEFLSNVAEFVVGLNELFGGFRAHAEQVARALRGPEVAFVLVTSPAPLAIDEALYMHERLVSASMRPAAFVVNGVHRLLPEPAVPHEALLEAARAFFAPPTDVEDLVGRLRRALDDERALAIADRVEVERLRARAAGALPVVEVPAFDADVHDLGALAAVAEHLIQRPTHAVVATA
ncbi:MAG: ArsA-related P-loop ATPase [Myxococcales bacterium]|nr:ArsA-related P-loop ATPase [Myxococcales bacterium]